MTSIPHVVSTATQPPLCNSHAHDQEPFEPAPELVRQFYPQAKSQFVTGDYLRRKWLPLCGPRFYSLIKALRGHCSYDIKEGEARCYPSEETLALECGVTRRTIINWLARVKEGEEQDYPDLRVGDFCHSGHGKALQQFLRIKPKLRYDRAGQRSVKTVNDYFVRMDDPPIPQDEPKIWARAYDLATLYLERQAEEAQRQAKEQERDARHQRHEHQAREQERDTHRQDAEAQAPQSSEQETKDTSAASFGPADFTYNNVKIVHSQQCENCAHNPLFSTPLPNTDTHRSMGEQQPNGDDTEIVLGRNKKTLVGGEPDSVLCEQQTHSEKKKGTGPAPRADKRVEKKQPTPFDLALLKAEQVAGGVLSDLLREAHARAPVVGMKTILIALVNAGAPPEKLIDLVYLGRNRVRRFRARGGHIHTTLPGYFINVMRNLATEAKDKDWDTALMEREDDIEHQEALWRSATRGVAAPKEQEPAPAEAEQEAPERDRAAPEATAAAEMAGDEGTPPAGGDTDADPPVSPTEEAAPAALEAEEEAIDEMWVDRLLPTIPGMSGHQGDVGMLWGFVRDALRPGLNTSRRQNLEALTPAWDAANPRELLLLCTASYTAHFLECTLRREIEEQRGKLLYQHFDAVRIQSVRHLPAWAEREKGER